MHENRTSGARTSRKWSRSWRGLVSLLLLLPAVVALSAAPTQAVGPGNFGTIKVHAADSDPDQPDNEPKVCAFNIEGFGFEEGFEGYIEFEVWGGDAPTGEAAGPYESGTADGDGYFATEYFNVDGGPVIQDGHYKVTLYGKFNGKPDYEGDKAKSKVFKVECPQTPTAPMPEDKCEPAYGTNADFQ